MAQVLKKDSRFLWTGEDLGALFKGWADVKDWDEAAHPREPAGTSEGGQFAGDGSSVALAEPVLHPAVVEVGGDAWNQQTATRLETEYQRAKPGLEKLIGKLEGMTLVEAVKITTNEIPQNWDALSSSQQGDAEEKWKEQNFQSAVDSEIESWRENTAVTEAAREVAEDDAWRTEKVQEWLDGYEPIPEGVTAEDLAAAITIEAVENYGDNAEKQLGEITFDEAKLDAIGTQLPGYNADQLALPGLERPSTSAWLTEEMRDEIRSVITDNWDQQVERVAGHMDAPDYLEQSANEMNAEDWLQMDDEAKYAYAKEEFGDDWVSEERTTSTLSAFARPDTYSLFDSNTTGYKATAHFATILSQQRTAQLLAERGITLSGDPTDPASLLAIAKEIDRETWNEWKDKSYTPMAKAMQLATARELGGLERYTPEEKLAIERWTTDNVRGGLPAMQVYARAKWETTQYLMEQADETDIKAYRAIYLNEQTDIKQRGITEATIRPAGSNGTYLQYPNLPVQRNGLASFSTDNSIANGWGGVGSQPANPVRVVIRAHVPRTAVMSLPVYGQNLHNEKEVVLMGTAWKAWDTWKGYAPLSAQVSIKSLAHPHQWLTQEGGKVWIDLSRMEEVLQLPHWLSGIRAQAVTRKSIAAKWAEDDHPREPAGSPEGGEFTSGAGGAYAHLTPVQAERLQQHEEWVKTDYTAKEEALVMDKDGRMMTITSNSKRLVRFTPEQLAAMPGSILTHNHPDDRIAKTKTGESAGFFSSKDLVFAHDNRLKEMRVTTTKKIYSVTPIQSTWPPKMLVTSLYNGANKSASQWVQDHPTETKGQVMVAWSDKMMDSSLKNYFRFKSWDRP